MLIIGDVHGKYKEYLAITDKVDASIQIGDLGYQNHLVEFKHKNHKFITGNHDNHETDYNLKNCLGRFGFTKLKGFKFFFVSGGFSIDKKFRQNAHFTGKWPKTYFENEELSYKECNDCLDLYTKTRPEIVLSHEAPRSIVNRFTNQDILANYGFNPSTFTTSTSELLSQMFEIHQPKLWIFGHYHRSWREIINGTQFILLDELETVEIPD